MIKISNLQENYQCRISGQESLVVDTANEKGGTGAGLRPHELLEAALASCMNISLRMQAAKFGLDLKQVETIVKVNRDYDGKSIFEYEYAIGDQLTADEMNKIAEILTNCPVRKTLSQQIEFKKIIGKN